LNEEVRQGASGDQGRGKAVPVGGLHPSGTAARQELSSSMVQAKVSLPPGSFPGGKRELQKKRIGNNENIYGQF